MLTFYVEGLYNLDGEETTDLLSFSVNKVDITKISILCLRSKIATEEASVATKKIIVPTIAKIKSISLDDNIRPKLPNINMSFGIYEEQEESESIKGTETQNTITKSFLPQYRRI